VALVAVGGRPGVEGWAEFGRRLRRTVRRFRVRRNPWGVVPAGLGVLVLVVAAWLAVG
jgi:hypothetical protein